MELNIKEHKIITLIARGLGTKQIGDILGHTEATTETLRGRIYKKTGTKNAPNLIDWAYQNGILKCELVS